MRVLKKNIVRLLAFYLPQFHPIPENDLWWGKGFTEWTNVAKARPLYPGHWQPHVPADFGFYDLRVAEVRQQQADMARNSGIEGFCYWHYWFGGRRRILERPFNEVLSSGEPDFPFCLAWANQSWTGIWHGSPHSILVEQTYPGPEDEEAHYRWASKAFHDTRYIKVDGCPVFIIFAPHDMPSTETFIRHWRKLAEANGLPGIYFVAISNIFRLGVDRYHHPILAPFDAITLLTPQDYLETWGQSKRWNIRRRMKEIDVGRFNKFKPQRWKRPARIDYADVVARAMEDLPRESRFLPSVLPNWDNTPRSGARGVVYENSTPKLFSGYLRKAIDHVSSYPPEKSIVFLKAWNEWAEGNYVEPDLTFGSGYLDAIRSVMQPSPPVISNV